MLPLLASILEKSLSSVSAKGVSFLPAVPARETGRRYFLKPDSIAMFPTINPSSDLVLIQQFTEPIEISAVKTGKGRDIPENAVEQLKKLNDRIVAISVGVKGELESATLQRLLFYQTKPAAETHTATLMLKVDNPKWVDNQKMQNIYQHCQRMIQDHESLVIFGIVLGIYRNL